MSGRPPLPESVKPSGAGMGAGGRENSGLGFSGEGFTLEALSQEQCPAGKVLAEIHRLLALKSAL